MGTNDVTRFPGGTQDKGLNTFEPDIGNQITWDEETVNVATGTRRGVGPRYGMAPLVGHADTETPSGVNCNSLRKSEGSTGTGLVNRELIFGIVPLVLRASALSTTGVLLQYYCFLVGLDATTGVCLDACVGSTKVSTDHVRLADLRAGLAPSTYREESPLARRHKTELMNLPFSAAASDMKTAMAYTSGKYWLSYAHVSVAGKRIPYFWQLAKAVTTPDATTAPNLTTWTIPLDLGGGLTPDVYGGSPSEMMTRESKDNNERRLKIWCLTTAGAYLDMTYEKVITDANTQGLQPYSTTPQYVTLTGATKGGASVAYNTAAAALINDSGAFTNSRHDAVLIAGDKPIAAVFQDWLHADNGVAARWVDLSSVGCCPREGIAIQDPAYGETRAVAIIAPGALSSLGAAGSNYGILQAATRYDLGFSYYNKTIDYESNVAYARTLTTGGAAGDTQGYAVATFVGLSSNQNAFTAFAGGGGVTSAPWEFSSAVVPAGNTISPRLMSINDYEIRWYYRESGTNEWLPAGSYDAAQWWFYTKWATVGAEQCPLICTGPVGALPGGQPNGFIDYSPLPKQRYICTLVYKNRAFWWSEKSMHFSMTNNIYAYPTRNITPVPSGVWRGGVVHTQLGETLQTSRLVIFGSDQAFVGRFTGVKLTQNVRISADTVGQFDVDGSDFDMDYLCDATAYSYRAAVVAEGILYFWGPQGVYADDGIKPPEKISLGLEPDIYSYVDTGRIDEVHAVYNKTTRDIIWFYPPKVSDSSYPTYGLTLNVDTGEFTPIKFRCQVDAAQNIKIERDSTPDEVDGERVLLHCRATAASTVSRTFFYDHLCKAGDQYPGGELVVKSISTPSTGKRRLTMAAGGVALTSIAVGDYIAIHNAKGYAPELTLGDDMIATVDAVNNGSSYVDIILPTGASLDGSITLTSPKYFPVYHAARGAGGVPAAGLHTIPFTVQTNYWLPTSLVDSWNWLYFHMLFKYEEWPAPVGAQVTFAHRTLKSGAYVSGTLVLSDNSDGHCQIHHPLSPGSSNASVGQALKYRFTGHHIGHLWTLEYLEAHCTLEDGFTCKEFEG